MGVIQTTGLAAWRFYQTDGVPATGEHEPAKSEIHTFVNTVDAQFSALQLAQSQGAYGFTTLAALNAFITAPNNALARLQGDPGGPSVDGFYRFTLVGTTWTRIGGLGFWFTATNTVAGTGAFDVATGTQGTAYGTNALGNVVGGDGNTAIGHGAGLTLTGGVGFNVFVGNDSGNNALQKVDAEGSIAIGEGSYTTENYQAVFGGPSISETILRGRIQVGGEDAIKQWPAEDNYFFGPAGPGVEPTGHGNHGFGLLALSLIDTGVMNTAAGFQALGAAIDASDNTAFGAGAGQSIVSGVGSTSMGRLALADATNAGGNTAIGDTALEHTTTGISNCALGYSAAIENLTGNDIVAIGVFAAGAQTAAHRTTAIGSETLLANLTSHDNTVVGYRAGFALTSAQNSAIGSESLRVVSTGARNAALGYRAGFRTTTGSDNTFLGTNAGESGSQALTASNSTALGANSYTTANNQMVFGDINVTENVFHGTLTMTEMTAPAAPAANEGRIFFQDNGAGKTQAMVIFATGAAQQIAIQP